MAFNVQYSFNNGATTGTATSIAALVTAIENLGVYNLTQCTLSGTAEGELENKVVEEDGNGGVFTSVTPLFAGCTSLTSVDLSNLNTSNVTNMSTLFANCSSLTSVDLSNLNTSNVTAMNSMFSGCSSLKTLDLSSFDTRNVTDMEYMFSSCSSLTSIKVSKNLWDTSKLKPSYEPTYAITGSMNMFYNCTRLPNFNSSYVDKTKAISRALGGYLDVIGEPLAYYKYYEHYSDGVRVIPKSTDMFDFVTQEDYDSITSPDPDMLYFIIE